MRARKARLTALALPKAAATSGSSSTTLVPRRSRAAYLFRTPLEKSYSGRMVSRSPAAFLAFFIVVAFRTRGRTGTDDSNLITSLGVRNYQEAPQGGLA